MTDRERVLEAALKEIRSYLSPETLDSDKELALIIDAALATKPTPDTMEAASLRPPSTEGDGRLTAPSEAASATKPTPDDPVPVAEPETGRAKVQGEPQGRTGSATLPTGAKPTPEDEK
jgi:hypothetical protein